MVPRIVLSLVLLLLATLASANVVDQTASAMAEEAGQEKLEKCDNDNSCSPGLECVRIGIRKRCIPRTDCLRREVDSFQKSFDVEAYKAMVMAQAGVTEAEVLEAGQESHDDPLVVQKRPIKALFETMQLHPGPFLGLGEALNRCSSGDVSVDEATDEHEDRRRLVTLQQLRLLQMKNVQIAVGVRLEYKFQSGTILEAPSMSQIMTVVDQTEDFYTKILKAAYPNLVTQVTQFNGRSFDEDSEFPQSIAFAVNAFFPEGDTTSEEDVYAILENADYNGDYINNYVRKANGIFERTIQVRFSRRPMAPTAPFPAPTIAPTGGSAPAPIPVPAPLPVPAPVPIPVPIPAPQPAPAPAPAPAPQPAPQPAPAPQTAPVPVPVPAPVPQPVPQPAPQPITNPQPAPSPKPVPSPSPPPVTLLPTTVAPAPTMHPTVNPKTSSFLGLHFELGAVFDGSLSILWELDPPNDPPTIYVKYCFGVGLQAYAGVSVIYVIADTLDQRDKIDCLSSLYDLDIGLGLGAGYGLGVCLLTEPAFLYQELNFGLGVGLGASGFSMCSGF